MTIFYKWRLLMSNPSIKKPLNNNGLTNVSGVQPATQKQLSLDLKIEKLKEINALVPAAKHRD